MNAFNFLVNVSACSTEEQPNDVVTGSIGQLACQGAPIIYQLTLQGVIPHQNKTAGSEFVQQSWEMTRKPLLKKVLLRCPYEFIGSSKCVVCVPFDPYFPSIPVPILSLNSFRFSIFYCLSLLTDQIDGTVWSIDTNGINTCLYYHFVYINFINRVDVGLSNVLSHCLGTPEPRHNFESSLM